MLGCKRGKKWGEDIRKSMEGESVSVETKTVMYEGTMINQKRRWRIYQQAKRSRILDETLEKA